MTVRACAPRSLGRRSGLRSPWPGRGSARSTADRRSWSGRPRRSTRFDRRPGRAAGRTGRWPPLGRRPPRVAPRRRDGREAGLGFPADGFTAL